MLQGKFEQCVGAAQAEFLADVRAVIFDRAVMNEKFGGDFLAGFIGRDQLQDAVFGGRQAGEAGDDFGQVLRALTALEQIPC